MSLDKKDIKELKRRGFDTNDIAPKPKRKRSYEIKPSFQMDDRRILIWIAIILFVTMLMLIPQCIYFLKALEQLAELGI